MELITPIPLLDYNTLCRLEDDIDNQLGQPHISGDDAENLTKLKSNIQNEIKLQKNGMYYSKCMHLNQRTNTCSLTDRDCKECMKDFTKLCQQARADQFIINSQAQKLGEKPDSKYETLWNNLKDLADAYVDDVLCCSQIKFNLKDYGLSKAKLSETVTTNLIDTLGFNGVPIEDAYPKIDDNAKGTYIVIHTTKDGIEKPVKASTLKEAREYMYMTAITNYISEYPNMLDEFTKAEECKPFKNYDELKEHHLVQKFMMYIADEDCCFEYTDDSVCIEYAGEECEELHIYDIDKTVPSIN